MSSNLCRCLAVQVVVKHDHLLPSLMVDDSADDIYTCIFIKFLSVNQTKSTFTLKYILLDNPCKRTTLALMCVLHLDVLMDKVHVFLKLDNLEALGFTVDIILCMNLGFFFG